MPNFILIRGGGDLATGVALRLHRAGLKVIIAELPEPLAVRRTAAFAEAVYAGEIKVEDVIGRRVGSAGQAFEVAANGTIPVIVDPDADVLRGDRERFPVLIDARLIKRPPEIGIDSARLVIGLGPGFTAGVDCHATIETNRGHMLGRVIWDGTSSLDTAVPEGDPRRVLRAPVDGMLAAHAAIGDHLAEGQLIASINTSPNDAVSIVSPFKGVLRGLIHPGLVVNRGLKIGDVDPRDDPRYCHLASDKSLAIGGGVLEAILGRADLRSALWD